MQSGYDNNNRSNPNYNNNANSFANPTSLSKSMIAQRSPPIYVNKIEKSSTPQNVNTALSQTNLQHQTLRTEPASEISQVNNSLLDNPLPIKPSIKNHPNISNPQIPSTSTKSIRKVARNIDISPEKIRPQVEKQKESEEPFEKPQLRSSTMRERTRTKETVNPGSNTLRPSSIRTEPMKVDNKKPPPTPPTEKKSPPTSPEEKPPVPPAEKKPPLIPIGSSKSFLVLSPTTKSSPLDSKISKTTSPPLPNSPKPSLPPKPANFRVVPKEELSKLKNTSQKNENPHESPKEIEDMIKILQEQIVEEQSARENLEEGISSVYYQISDASVHLKKLEKELIDINDQMESFMNPNVVIPKVRIITRKDNLAGDMNPNSQTEEISGSTEKVEERGTQKIELQEIDMQEDGSFARPQASEDAGKKKVEVISYQDLAAIWMRLKDPQVGVQIGERTWMLMKFKMVFKGSEAIDWMIKNYPQYDRKMAKKIMNQMLKSKLICHLSTDLLSFTEPCFYKIPLHAVNDFF